VEEKLNTFLRPGSWCFWGRWVS